MKKKASSQSAFFNVRVLIGVFMVLGGVSLALFATANPAHPASKQAPQGYNKSAQPIDPELLPPGFDCSKVHELGIDKQDNMRAGLIMIACGLVEGRSSSPGDRFAQWVQKLLPQPLAPSFIGGADVDAILPDGSFPKVTQSETMEWCGPNNTCVINYNDSRTSPGCYSGISYSTDNGTTWHPSQQLCTGHGTNFGDPIVVYNAALNMWFAGDLATGCGGQGIGMWTSPDGVTWTAGACAHNGSSDDRESMWVDNNPASPHFGRMYISWNDFAQSQQIRVTFSDNGTTWSAPVNVNNTFIRNIQLTGDLQGGGNVYVAAMNEGSGGGLQPRQNIIYRSTDGGATWNAGVNAGSACQGPGRSTSGFFALVFSSIWRHMGWGQPAASGNVVSLDYACCGQNVPCNTATDHGDIYYIRSTDAGLTFAAPVKLNTDSGTAMQWQPSLLVSQGGVLFAGWYDQREANGGADLNCTVGSPNPCYRRWGRMSFDNGATWQPDDQVGRAMSGLPSQPDSAVQPTYEGDYDYHSSFGTTGIGAWTDGRTIISGQAQQDVFTNLVQLGFAVVSTVPACNSVISTQPVDFTVNLSDAVSTSTVGASDFTVNGIASNLAPTFQNGNQTIVFHYSTTPVTTQGLQTMHIPAGAFLRASDNSPVVEFMCTFCYAVTPLQVTTTVPPVGGTFSPPAPGDYTFDVNFNQAVDTASVQDNDLTITGNVGGSVTGHSFLNGNQTVRFNLHFNFGGSVTLSIAAGSITAGGCNTNAAFTGNYTVAGCPPQGYTTATTTGNITAGGTDIGNHCDDCNTNITLPFPVNIYGAPVSVATVGSNGDIQLTASPSEKLFYVLDQCVPVDPDPSSHGPFLNTLFPFYADLRTDVNPLQTCADCGVFTQTLGTAPNRQFVIRWKTTYFDFPGTAEFEVLLTEGSNTLSVIYGATHDNGLTATLSGIQQDLTHFTSFSCDQAVLTPGLRVNYMLPGCASPTPTPTATSSPTPTATATATSTSPGLTTNCSGGQGACRWIRGPDRIRS